MKNNVRLALSMPIVLTAALAASIFYRATTMSITWDEAYTVSVYATSWTAIFSSEQFLANNHILHTVLVRMMFLIAPWEEWSMRFPACLAGLGLLAAVWRLGFLLLETTTDETSGTKRPAQMFLGITLLLAIVSLHPLVFQFLSFARGYGLSLCFMLFGLDGLLRFARLRRWSAGTIGANAKLMLLWSGACFGLSVAANLTAAMMNTAIILSALAFQIWEHRCSLPFLRTVLLWFCPPGAAIVALLYVPVFSSLPSFSVFNYASDDFFQGMLSMSVWTLGETLSVSPERIQRILLGVPISDDLYWTLAVLLAFFVVPVILVLALIVTFQARIPGKPPETNSAPINGIGILSVSLLVYAVILFVLSGWSHPVFPKDRTGVFPIVCFLILTVLLGHYLRNVAGSVFYRRCGACLRVMVLVSALHFTSLLTVPYYHNFWYLDSDVKRVMVFVENDVAAHREPCVVVCSGVNIASVEYYVKKSGLSNIEVRCIRRKEDAERWGGDLVRTYLYLHGSLTDPLLEKLPHLHVVTESKGVEMVLLSNAR